MSLAGDVRKILQEGPADFETLAERLDIPKADGRGGRKRLRSILTDLREAGSVTMKLMGPLHCPLYRLVGRSGLPGETQTRMARAVRLSAAKNQTVTCKDVAALSGCTQEYAARYLRFLREQGYLQPGKARKLSRFGLGLAYRVAPGREKEEPPHWNRRAEEVRKAAEARSIILAPIDLTAYARGMHEGMEQFISELRVLEKHNDQVKKVLQEMEADLARFAGLIREAKGADPKSPDQ